MAKVEHRRARKAYPEAGIEKGDMYYFAQIKTGPRSSRVIRQKTPIRPSQLTSSEYLQAVFALQEEAENICSLDDFSDIAERLREIGEEQREKFDNMPEALQQGDTGQMLETRASSCEEIADEIDNIVTAFDPDDIEPEEGEDRDEALNRVENELISDAQAALGNVET